MDFALYHFLWEGTKDFSQYFLVSSRGLCAETYAAAVCSETANNRQGCACWLLDDKALDFAIVSADFCTTVYNISVTASSVKLDGNGRALDRTNYFACRVNHAKSAISCLDVWDYGLGIQLGITVRLSI